METDKLHLTISSDITMAINNLNKHFLLSFFLYLIDFKWIQIQIGKRY